MIDNFTPPRQNKYQNSLFSFTVVPPGTKEWSGEHRRSEIGFNFSDVVADWSIDGSAKSKKTAPKNSFVYYPTGIQHFVRAENRHQRLSFAWSDAYLEILMAGATKPGILQEFRDYQNDPILTTLAATVVASISSDGPFLELQMDGYAQAMLGQFLNVDNQRESDKQNTGDRVPISRAINYAMENLQSNLTIATLAEEAGLSPWHFARTFKTVIGETPHRWVMNQRIKKAPNLLQFTKLSLGEIAFECGFAGPAHLGNIIKKWTGKTPREMRAT